MKLLLYFHDYEFTRNCLVSLGFFFEKRSIQLKILQKNPVKNMQQMVNKVRIIPETIFFRITKHYKRSRQEIYITNLLIKDLVLLVVADLLHRLYWSIQYMSIFITNMHGHFASFSVSDYILFLIALGSAFYLKQTAC